MFWNDIKETFCTLQVDCMGELGHRQWQNWEVLVWPMGEEFVSELNLGLFEAAQCKINLTYVAKLILPESGSWFINLKGKPSEACSLLLILDL